MIRRAEAQRQRSASARHDVLDQRRLGRLAANRDKFRQSLLFGPLSICYSCGRYTYPSGGSYVGCDNALFRPLHHSDNSHILPEGEESVWVCTHCRTSLKKGKIPSFSVVNNMHVAPVSTELSCLNKIPSLVVNNMHVAPVPTELSCLNITEKRLICRVQAFMKLVVLPHGQRAMQGQAINFPVNTSELCSALPWPVDRAGIIPIAPPQGSSSDSTEVQRPSQYYAVRRPYVFRATRWLKAHNQLYRDVEIDDDSLNEPNLEPHQPQQESEEGSPELESSVIRRDFTLPNVDVQNVITDGNAPVHQLERIRGAPVSLFSDREAEQLSFPFLFPDGVNGYRTARDPSTSTLDYFQTRLLSSDPRWAAHVPYLFWACNVMEQHRLQDNISGALRMRSSVGHALQGPVVNRLTAGQLREVSDKS